MTMYGSSSSEMKGVIEYNDLFDLAQGCLNHVRLGPPEEVIFQNDDRVDPPGLHGFEGNPQFAAAQQSQAQTIGLWHGQAKVSQAIIPV